MTTLPFSVRATTQNLAQAGLTILVVGVCVWMLAGRLADADPGLLLRALTEVRPTQWLGAAIGVAISFAAVSCQERVLLRHFGLRVPAAVAARSAIAAAAVGQAMGFGPLTGALVRRRLLPGLTMGQALKLSTAMTVGFAAVIALMTALAIKLSPDFPYQQAAGVVLALGVVTILLCTVQPSALRRRVRLPNLFTALSFIGWLALDLLALAITLWILFPAAATPAFLVLLPAFLLAFGAGLASGAPAGVGVFELTLLMQLRTTDEPELMAAVVAYRIVAYALPAVGGALLAISGPGRAPRLEPMAEPDAALAMAAPQAEVRLAGQSGLALMTAGEGRAWLGTALPHTRVAMGNPFPVRSRLHLGSAFAHLVSRATEESRLPCLYKVDGRLAAVVRRAGFRVLHIADEAWLAPAQFTGAGHRYASLRRKLRHADKAGVTCRAAGDLPLTDMAELSCQWIAAHGGERGFSVGRFDACLLRQQRVFLARNPAGDLIAFISFHAVAQEWLLDMMRFGPGLPDGTMHALVRCAITTAAQEQVPRLSLAAVPVPGFGLGGVLGNLATRLTKPTNGLAQFKRSFAPHWSPRYMAAPGRIALTIAALELCRAIHRPASC